MLRHTAQPPVRALLGVDDDAVPVLQYLASLLPLELALLLLLSALMLLLRPGRRVLLWGNIRDAKQGVDRNEVETLPDKGRSDLRRFTGLLHGLHKLVLATKGGDGLVAPDIAEVRHVCHADKAITPSAGISRHFILLRWQQNKRWYSSAWTAGCRANPHGTIFHDRRPAHSLPILGRPSDRVNVIRYGPLLLTLLSVWQPFSACIESGNLWAAMRRQGPRHPTGCRDPKDTHTHASAHRSMAYTTRRMTRSERSILTMALASRQRPYRIDIQWSA